MPFDVGLEGLDAAVAAALASAGRAAEVARTEHLTQLAHENLTGLAQRVTRQARTRADCVGGVQPPESGSPIRSPKRSSSSGTVSGRISRPWRSLSCASSSGSALSAPPMSFELAEELLEPGRRDDLEDPAGLVARVPERVPLVARLEDEVARAGLDDVVAQQRAHAPLEHVAVLVLAGVQVQRRGERARGHRVLDQREPLARLCPVDHEADADAAEEALLGLVRADDPGPLSPPCRLPFVGQ